MQPPHKTCIGSRLARFIVLLGLAAFLVFGVLPALTSNVPILDRMAHYLDENGIDPTRYYYTDVEQVREAELYLRTVLEEENNSSGRRY